MVSNLHTMSGPSNENMNSSHMQPSLSFESLEKGKLVFDCTWTVKHKNSLQL